MKTFTVISLIVTSLVFALSCNKKEDDKTGVVRLQMASVTTAGVASDGSVISMGTCPSGFTCISPTSFQMKILAAYVVEDVDSVTSNNVGQIGMVWLNPKCSSINDCKPSMVDYSDLTDPTAFNAELNSQALAIKTGSYKYVRLEFCQGSADSANVKVNSGSAVKEFTYGGCGVTSIPLTTPISLAEGQSLTIAVSYDLKDGEAYWAAGGSCPSASNFCIGGIDLVPSIVQ
tara:strand:- start:25134 stop:25826 length:693 start_codon:yes stop_codon:yes gene_type:complete